MGVFLFIFESIGTSELFLIAVVGLIFLGPRKMPQIARQIGKIMAEFRSTGSQFRETWEREVNFEEEARTIRESFNEETGASDTSQPIAKKLPEAEKAVEVPRPAIKEVDASAFAERPVAENESRETPDESEPPTAATAPNDRRNWI